MVIFKYINDYNTTNCWCLKSLKILSEELYKDDYQVNKTYSKMYAFEPNYTLPSINITGQILEKMKTLNRKMWLAAGFMLNDDKITTKAKNGDFDLSFNDSEKWNF